MLLHLHGLGRLAGGGLLACLAQPLAQALAQAYGQHAPQGARQPGARCGAKQPIAAVGGAQDITVQHHQAQAMADQQAGFGKGRDAGALPEGSAHEEIAITGQHGHRHAMLSQRPEALDPACLPGADGVITKIDLEQIAQDIQLIARLEGIEESFQARCGGGVRRLQVAVGDEIGAHAARQAIMPRSSHDKGRDATWCIFSIA